MRWEISNPGKICPRSFFIPPETEPELSIISDSFPNDFPDRYRKIQTNRPPIPT